MMRAEETRNQRYCRAPDQLSADTCPSFLGGVNIGVFRSDLARRSGTPAASGEVCILSVTQTCLSRMLTASDQASLQPHSERECLGGNSGNFE